MDRKYFKARQPDSGVYVGPVMDFPEDSTGLDYSDISIFVDNVGIDQKPVKRAWEWLRILAIEYFLEPRDKRAQDDLREIVAHEDEAFFESVRKLQKERKWAKKLEKKAAQRERNGAHARN